MGVVEGGITAEIAEFLGRQRLFFVATAPLAASGRVNLSPRGLDCFRVLDARSVAWLDLTGSGVETIAHLRENGRIVLMFCAFEGPPRIVRLHGRGEALLPDTAEYAALRPRFSDLPGERAIVRVRVDRVATSCGYGVPQFRYDGERDQLHSWCEKKGPEGLAAYRAEKNAASLDGLPGLTG